MSDETSDQDLPEEPTSGDPGPGGSQDDPGSLSEAIDQIYETASEDLPVGEATDLVTPLVDAFVDDHDASGELDALESEASGCRGCLLMVFAVAALALVGLGMFLAVQSGWLGFAGEADGDPSGGQSSAAIDAATDSGSTDEAPVGFLPRSGTWEIENLPFLPECGPGSLGSGFQEGTIEVLDDGAFIIATGQPGTASFELVLIDAAPGRLEYLGVEPITGIEMTMVFTSPTELQATIRNGGDICLERPATGAWDREIGEPDPDAPEDEPLPEWMPPDFPASGSGGVDTIETPTSKSVTVVVVDTHPTDVLFSIAEWAVEKDHPILERSFTTLTIQLPENQLMYVEVVDIGNFNTQLTVTIEEM